MSAIWKSRVGSITSVDWPVGVGAGGNEGVTAMIARIKGSIGYVEYAYAKQSKLTATKLRNTAGKCIAPSFESFTTAARMANWERMQYFAVVGTNQPREH